ncbi:MAG: hypothetical protein ACNS63_11795 [Candidatus Nitrospinota bacterium M3_3B_026]
MKEAIAPVVAVLLLVFASPAGAQGRGAEFKAGRIDRRLQSVTTLVETSSLALRIRSSGSVEAENVRLEAEAVLEQAEQAAARGDDDEAGRLLIEAQKKVYQAASLLGGGPGAGEKKRRDFKHRLKSVKALLEANRRVGGEIEDTGEKERRRELAERVASLLEEAMALYDAGEVGKGREKLDEAYATATSSLRKMRHGMTRVRDLKFETKEEEFEFVKRYNDDYLNLADKFVSDYLKKTEDTARAERMKKYFKRGKELRVEADGLASAGDFEKGIEALEQSTRQIKQAIRATGFMIP